MELTNLPTDNFYIFLSLAGLSIAMFSISTFIKQRNILRKRVCDIKKEISKICVETTFFQSKLDIISTKIRIFKTQLEKEYNIDIDDFISTDTEVRNGFGKNLTLEQFNKSADGLVQLQTQFLENKRGLSDLENLKNSLKLDSKELDKSARELIYIFLFSFVGLILGIAISVCGFYYWFTKHQFYQDNLIKLEYENAVILKNSAELNR